MTQAEQIKAAHSAFDAAAEMGMQPVLECEGFPHRDFAEFNVLLRPNEMVGLLHEDIEAALRIACDHGGRLWLGPPDGQLSIVWPLPDEPAGPGDSEEGQRSPVTQAKRAAHGVAA